MLIFVGIFHGFLYLFLVVFAGCARSNSGMLI